MDIEQLLRIFGLRDKRARVYIACLELGSSTAAPIAKKAAVLRTTTYDILEDLQIRGLVIYKEVNGKRYYQVSDPRRLKQILQGQLKQVESTLPELLALYKPSKEKPVARMYEGEEISKIYDELLAAPFIWAYGDYTQIIRYTPQFPNLLKQMIKRNIPIRDVVPPTLENKEYKIKFQHPKYHVRFLPAGMSLESDTIIYGHKVALISYGETVHGLVIESKEIVATQKMLFELLWQQAEEK